MTYYVGLVLHRNLHDPLPRFEKQTLLWSFGFGVFEAGGPCSKLARIVRLAS